MNVRLRIVPLLSVIASFAAFGAGCSASAEGPPPDDTVTAFCNDWASAYCQLDTSCEFSEATCAAYQVTVCTSFAGDAEASGTRKYNQPNGKSCIDALNHAFAGSPPSVPATTLLALETTCNEAFIGDVASDGACTSDYDCVGGLVCAPILGTSNSVCASVSEKSPGGICGDPGDECQDNSYCAPVSGAAPVCTASPGIGDPCSDAVPCDSTDRCVNGECAARALLGDTCSTDSDCAASAPYCDLYPPAACTTGLTFSRGGYDCNGIEGVSGGDAGG